MGRNGGWVALSDDGRPIWEGVPKDLEDELIQSVPIKSIVLVLDAEDDYFLELEDGKAYTILQSHGMRRSTRMSIVYDQRVLTAYEGALATSGLNIIWMNWMDELSDVVNEYTRRTERRTIYRTHYEDGDRDEDEDEDEGEGEDNPW
ncbi:hypothetical protein FRB94_002211 [Tulasnella sp. JGI-2019a]|nr:hypothetical protein FRB93_007065 [Tulasnella sp. JGI-2019a]KAG8987106.1 hypothetical protein FRB94_002211 [Tulasnella sp. JGI-2019a]